MSSYTTELYSRIIVRPSSEYIQLFIIYLPFSVGYPIATWLTETPLQTFGVNKTGQVGILPIVPISYLLSVDVQVPQMMGNWGLIDLETPEDAKNFASYKDGSGWSLVFSDEFNTDGRTFYPGDDPYWEAGELCANHRRPL